MAMTPAGGASVFGRIAALALLIVCAILIYLVLQHPRSENFFFVPTGEYEGTADPPLAAETIDETRQRVDIQNF